MKINVKIGFASFFVLACLTQASPTRAATNTGLDTPTGIGDMPFAIGGNQVMDMDANGLSVGNARINAGGTVQLGNDMTTACTSTNAGSLRFDSATKTFEGCDGISWAPLNKPHFPANKHAVTENYDGWGQCEAYTDAAGNVTLANTYTAPGHLPGRAIALWSVTANASPVYHVFAFCTIDADGITFAVHDPMVPTGLQWQSTLYPWQ